MIFVDRQQAGRLLGAALARYRSESPVILALPRGGVPVAVEVAKALEAPLDLVLVRKIGVPLQPELAAGAVVDADEPIVVRNDAVIAGTHLSDADFDRLRDAEVLELSRRRKLYLAARPRVDLRGRTAIVVDDGIATGATMRVALRGLRTRLPARLVVAIPVAPQELVVALGDEVDEVVCLETPVPFLAVGEHYADFPQVSDDEVIALLAEADAAQRRT